VVPNALAAADAQFLEPLLPEMVSPNRRKQESTEVRTKRL
jgi:hypothetical protein